MVGTLRAASENDKQNGHEVGYKNANVGTTCSDD